MRNETRQIVVSNYRNLSCAARLFSCTNAVLASLDDISIVFSFRIYKVDIYFVSS